MKYSCQIVHSQHGWTIEHDSRDLGSVRVTAATREEAVEKMRNELRYRLELCPCSGEIYRDVEIQLVEAR